MAESLSSILSCAVENLSKLVIEEGKFLQGVSDQVTLLRDDLEWIQMFLRYADTRQTARDTIQQCVPKFRAVAYEASDLVEDYALRLSISTNGGFTSTLKRIACIATEGYTLHDLGVEIQRLRTRISNLTKHFGEYGHVMARTEEGESIAPSRQQQLRHTYSVVADEDVVELPDDVQVLVDYLLNEVAERKISVASIFGMRGIGVTNLKQWMVEAGAMPKLSGLRIHYCKQLEMIPDGLRCLTTLEEVSLLHMPEQFNNRVRMENGQQGEDYNKISHVPSVKIYSWVGGYQVETVCPSNPV